MVSLSINFSMFFIIMSILASCELEEYDCLGSLSFILSPSSLLHSPSSLFFFLAAFNFTSTYMEYFIISAREVDLFLLNNKVNSLSKASTYWSWEEPWGGLNWEGMELYIFINLSKNSWKYSLSLLLMEWYWDKYYLGFFLSSHFSLKEFSKS